MKVPRINIASTVAVVTFWASTASNSIDAFSPVSSNIHLSRIGSGSSISVSHVLPTERHIRLNAHSNQDSNDEWTMELLKNVKTTLGSLAFMVTVLTSPIQLELNRPDTTAKATSTLPFTIIASNTVWALSEEQLLVVDVWNEVTRQYVDSSYNGMGLDGWKQKRLDAVKKLNAMGPQDNKDAVYETIRNMLKPLNDPYTRFLTPEQYESIATIAKGGGSSGSIGVTLLPDARSGNIMVMGTTPDGPAAKAGIQSGDVIVEVDGMELRNTPAEVVAAKCRGEIGSSVNVEVLRDNTPKRFTVERAKLKVNPVRTSTFTSDSTGETIGIMQLTSFSQETTNQVVDAIRELKNQKASALVLDLRGNVGGYMPAGVDVAKLFLAPQQRVISEVDKQNRKTIYIADGIGSETSTPLYVLVDEKTASASEILTAALQGNQRATVVGSVPSTFGKGRIQNVQPLADGSGVAVTKAKYLSPTDDEIDKVGIKPNIQSKQCGKTDSAKACLADIV